MSSSDSVGTLLADIANHVSEGLRVLSFADKRQWGPDEHDQLRALQAVLDQAKRDFQELSRLVNGQAQYEHDRHHESMQQLRALSGRFRAHTQDLKDWARNGGPINSIWIRDTRSLQRDLHRAQRRAARRVFTSEQEASARCLGAFLVYRRQRAWNNSEVGYSERDYQRRYAEELLACKHIGGFERFGEEDIAFVCDFCDGHLVWEDLESVPTVRTAQELAVSPISPVSPTTGNPHWQATATKLSNGERKEVVFAPVAIANHIPPHPADWQARVICPFCEEESGQPQDKDDEEDVYRPDTEFEDLAALQEHLEWQHGGSMGIQDSMPAISIPTSTNSCQIM